MESISFVLSQKPLYTIVDKTNVVIPNPHPLYLAYDNQLNLVPSNSGALQVENPNQLEQLLTQELTIQNDGFLHVYACPEPVERVSNGSSDKEINFDNSCGERSRTVLITTAKGKARQINHYYPYGLRISGLNGISEDYKNMYTSKELQTGEFDQEVSSGLEMYDFHARFYDPQLGRWFTPDPAMQFSNPYLGIGNNPVVFIDPDGEFITWSFHKNGFSIGVNFTPIGLGVGGGLNFGWGDGFSSGVYGEVGYRVGGTGFGAGAAVTQSVDYNFRHQTATTTTSAGAYASLGPLNAGANVGSTFDLTNGQHAGYSWGVSAGIGVGNEKGGVGLFVGYGSGGWNYGVGGYYDPRVSFNNDNVTLVANNDGTYTEQLASEGFTSGPSRNDLRHTTNLVNNPNVTVVVNPDGTFTYIVNTPNRHRITDVSVDPSAGLQNQLFDSRNGQATFTTLNPVNSATFLSSRPHPGNYFNFSNFNTYYQRPTYGLRPRHLNLFGYTWFR